MQGQVGQCAQGHASVGVERVSVGLSVWAYVYLATVFGGPVCIGLSGKSPGIVNIMRMFF